MADAALRWMIAGEWRQHPGRIAVAALAIAVGVALGFAVHLVNGSALASFGQAIRTVNGAADLQITATSALGMDEALYGRVALAAGVADASPVVMLKAKSPSGEAIPVLGLDVIRAANVTPTTIGVSASGPGTGATDPFASDALFLSRAALAAARVRVGDSLAITANGHTQTMVVRGTLPAVADGQRLGAIDIAASQSLFGRLGRIDRIDLKLADGAQPGAARLALARLLPPDAILSDGDDQTAQSDALSRAYRVNLDMLALVALLTGSFLVYATQSLSVARRLQAFALLRTLGMQKRALIALVATEGALAGLAGSVLGLLLGYGLAAGAMALLGGDLGGGYFGDAPPPLIFAPGAALAFFALGMAAAIGGSVLPALDGARAAPAVALKNAGDALDPRARPGLMVPLVLAGLGIGAALMPAAARLPLFGYLAIALLLAAGIAAMPGVARLLLAPLARRPSGAFAFDLAVQHLRGTPGAAASALSGIVASTALMIAMAIMVTSFRGAVDEWLGDILSGDLYLRSDPGSGGFDPAAQGALARVKGVERIMFSRTVPLVLAADQPPMQLIARPVMPAMEAMTLIGSAVRPPRGAIPVWLSEPAARILGRSAGQSVRLPLGHGEHFAVAGVWRDYARQQGAIAIESSDYERMSGDLARDAAMVVLAPGASADSVSRALIAASPPALQGQVQTAQPAVLRRFALTLFDRSFAITYLLEAVAIIVGLAGVAATTSAQALARTREFGMLRHIGVSRGQVLAMLGSEGALLGLVGSMAGVLLGIAISQVLIHVVNPQSFNWTMSTRFPLGLMASVIAALTVAASATAMLAGRRALSVDAVRAVRADW
ncbi:ABC transporter permease [Novosphingobium sp. Chol11]|uniref:ABC transporter permease n=1 Tax=Novosphingobium sp. Chol11 TaxID=1385763 RepID=UPI0025D2FE24|nr:ABC transporter permease [Novosphingobium sp. Chol11]